jgi:hypothetical protein
MVRRIKRDGQIFQKSRAEVADGEDVDEVAPRARPASLSCSVGRAVSMMIGTLELSRSVWQIRSPSTSGSHAPHGLIVRTIVNLV